MTPNQEFSLKQLALLYQEKEYLEPIFTVLLDHSSPITMRAILLPCPAILDSTSSKIPMDDLATPTPNQVAAITVIMHEYGKLLDKYNTGEK